MRKVGTDLSLYVAAKGQEIGWVRSAPTRPATVTSGRKGAVRKGLLPRAALEGKALFFIYGKFRRGSFGPDLGVGASVWTLVNGEGCRWRACSRDCKAGPV